MVESEALLPDLSLHKSQVVVAFFIYPEFSAIRFVTVAGRLEWTFVVGDEVPKQEHNNTNNPTRYINNFHNDHGYYQIWASSFGKLQDVHRGFFDFEVVHHVCDRVSIAERYDGHKRNGRFDLLSPELGGHGEREC